MKKDELEIKLEKLKKELNEIESTKQINNNMNDSYIDELIMNEKKIIDKIKEEYEYEIKKTKLEYDQDE